MYADGTVVDIGKSQCPTCPTKCIDIDVSGGEVITSLSMGVADGLTPDGSIVDSFKMTTLNPQGNIKSLRSDYGTDGRAITSDVGQEFSADGECERRSESQLKRVLPRCFTIIFSPDLSLNYYTHQMFDNHNDQLHLQWVLGCSVASTHTAPQRESMASPRSSSDRSVELCVSIKGQS